MNRPISRKAFLRGLGLSATACTFPALIPSAVRGAASPSHRIQMACIGLGAMGQHHLRALLAEPMAQVVALCDVNQVKIEQSRVLTGTPAADTTRDFRELLARDDVDAVNIATPDHWHVPLALAALQAGKAVYCQKPLSNTVREGRLLADAVGRLDGILQTGSQQRSDPNFRFAAELVRNGYLGEIRHIEVGLEDPYNPNPGVGPIQDPPPGFDYDRWLGPAPWKPYTWERTVHFRGQFDYSGGYYSDWGAHHLDIVQWALGMDESGPVEVDGQGRFHTEGIFDVPMDFTVRYCYADGTPVTATNHLENGIRFSGTEGAVFVNRQRLETDPVGLRNRKIRPGEVRLPRSRGHLRDFFESVRDHRAPLAHAEIGHRTATVCHLGNISMILGRPLRWDPAAERFSGDDEANRLLGRAQRAPWGVR